MAAIFLAARDSRHSAAFGWVEAFQLAAWTAEPGRAVPSFWNCLPSSGNFFFFLQIQKATVKH
jgi:hypothetical protein